MSTFEAHVNNIKECTLYLKIGAVECFQINNQYYTNNELFVYQKV